jgi:MFS family permease
MSEGYRDVLGLPHAARLFSTALLGRLSFATVTLSLLLSVQDATGSFAAAGAATGAFGVVNVVASPFRARCVDRFGASRALLVMGVFYSAALVGAALACVAAAQVWVLVALAGVAGLFAPPLGSTMRVIWASLAPNPRMLTRAYSLDAVAEEVLFTTGPLLVGLLIVVATPVTALFATAAIALVGTTSFALAKAVRSRPGTPTAPHAHERPLRQRGFWVVLVSLVGVGVVLGTVETAVPAFAAERSSAALAGVLLALLSAGSGVAGLVYGHRTWRSRLAPRLVVLSVALTAVSALAALATNAVVIGIILVGIGVFLAPTVVTGYLLADALTAEHVRNEASMWINTAVNSGAAGGAALAGLLVDRSSTSVAFAVGAGIAVLATLTAAMRVQSVNRAVHEKALPEGRA